MANLDADVVLTEPPVGQNRRRLGYLAGDIAHTDCLGAYTAGVDSCAQSHPVPRSCICVRIGGGLGSWAGVASVSGAPAWLCWLPVLLRPRRTAGGTQRRSHHVTLFRWVQRFTPMLAEAAHPSTHRTCHRWFVDET